MDNITVYKSNALIQAGYRLDINEQRIILSCISQVNSNEELLSKDTFYVSARDLIKNWGVRPDNAYRELKKAVNNLFERYITIDLSDDEILKTRWISSIKYTKKNGSIEVCFAQKILPYLSQLKEQFTKYKLAHVAQMRSMYGIRLYELLLQYKHFGSREIEICWLRKQFEAEDKYKSIKDFKKRVIEPAIKDINETSDLWVKYSQRKTGRRVTHLIFEFGEKSRLAGTPGKKNKTKSKVVIDKAYVDRYASPGLFYADAKAKLQAEPEEEKQKKYAALHAEVHSQ